MQIETLTLDNMVWDNEFEQPQVAQELTRNVQGGAVVHEQAQTYGVAMRLTGAWGSRATVLALRALEAQPGQAWSVTLDDGRQFWATFDRRNGAAVVATPIRPSTQPQATDQYELTLQLITLQEPA